MWVTVLLILYLQPTEFLMEFHLGPPHLVTVEHPIVPLARESAPDPGKCDSVPICPRI